MLEFGLLGPLVAYSHSGPLTIGPPKRRALLIRLLLERGRAVPLGTLREDLWPDSPSSSSVSSVQAHISRLRDVLEPGRTRRGGTSVLVREPMGYALRVPFEAQDICHFERMLKDARRLLRLDRVKEADQEVTAALALWRGAPLAEATDYLFASREITRLEEAHMLAQELRVSILITEGNLEAALLAAEELTARTPLREVAWEMLVSTLYRSGRPAEALHRYARLRELLMDELGIAPGPRLQWLQGKILRQEELPHDHAYSFSSSA
ncbi:AfsR/SARP family transcriptional regulator [Streptomyces hirsutus]|uniref:AfsR/SARP family transcriptional regulator n=1 Tax=Streptomyces hirsutus TaxID=35620 RepID=UPI0034009921